MCTHCGMCLYWNSPWSLTMYNSSNWICAKRRIIYSSPTFRICKNISWEIFPKNVSESERGTYAAKSGRYVELRSSWIGFCGKTNKSPKMWVLQMYRKLEGSQQIKLDLAIICKQSDCCQFQKWWNITSKYSQGVVIYHQSMLTEILKYHHQM